MEYPDIHAPKLVSDALRVSAADKLLAALKLSGLIAVNTSFLQPAIVINKAAINGQSIFFNTMKMVLRGANRSLISQVFLVNNGICFGLKGQRIDGTYYGSFRVARETKIVPKRLI